MPSAVFKLRRLAMAAFVTALAIGALPASAAMAESLLEDNSNLDAPLFYQLLVGEMELRAGNPGAAYEILLDGARKTHDERLFRRATEIALQSRAGDQALDAAQSWRNAVPNSVDAHRYTAQLLVGLNRTAEAVEPLSAFLNRTPSEEQAGTIAVLPRLFGRGSDRKALAGVVEQVLQPYTAKPATRTAALVSTGRMRLQAEEPERALALAEEAQRADPKAEGPALLALELMPSLSRAEPLVQSYLTAKPEGTVVRLAYVRQLVSTQRYGDAVGQLETATRAEPTMAPAWLSLGALKLELKQPREAESALKRFVQLSQTQGEAPTPAASAPEDDSDDTQDASSMAEGLTQAYLLLAQAAEEQKNFHDAEQWLARIDDASSALSVQLRRASLMAKQGRLPEGRELIRKVPERGPQDARAKLLAESQLLRDVKQWPEAYKVLGQANERFPDDVDLLYEQAMMAEKLRRPDEMERLLRRVITLKPDHFHAYNALGYTLADRNTRLDEARGLVQRALDLAPNEPFIIDSLGWIEYRMGRREEALRHLQRAYQSRPDTEIAAHLGEVLWALGRRDEARKVWREGRDRDAANEVLKDTLVRLKVDL